MNDAAQIRRCSGAVRAKHPRFRPRFLPPTLTSHPNLKISNRESLRLEINVTQTKQTTQPHSNREVEALFSNRVRADNSARRYIARAVNRLCDCKATASGRRYRVRAVNRLCDCKATASGRRYRVRADDSARRYRVRADDSARRYIDRSTRHLNLRNSNRESRHSNREKSHPFQIATNSSKSTVCGRGQTHSQIPNFQPSHIAKSVKKHPQSFVSVRTGTNRVFSSSYENFK
jgi:hypothetical protein